MILCDPAIEKGGTIAKLCGGDTLESANAGKRHDMDSRLEKGQQSVEGTRLGGRDVDGLMKMRGRGSRRHAGKIGRVIFGEEIVKKVVPGNLDQRADMQHQHENGKE